MEALNQRLDIVEERMEELDKENGGLKKEIASLKKQNIDYQEELTAVKSQMNSLDRKYRIKSQPDSSLASHRPGSYDEEVSEMKNELKILKKKARSWEKSGNSSSTVTMVTDDAKDKRLTNLEQQVHGIIGLQKLLNKLHFDLQSKKDLKKQLVDLEKRLGTLESVEDMKRKSIFNVGMTKSTPFSNQITRLDEWVDSSYINIGDVFDKRTCSFNLPVYGLYALDFEIRIQDGEIELYLETEKHHLFIAKSDKDKKVSSRIFIADFDTKVHYVAVRRVSGNPKGLVCVAGWLIHPL